MLKNSSLKLLRDQKNLLAFSAGVDSTALFFILVKNNIKFDIAIVNYNTRQQSKKELAYAKELAQTYNLKCHFFNADTIEKNFEARARELRYRFFEKIITQFSYDTLLTAHHLGDRFEWMLMQFCKGAGCAELAGMYFQEKRESYTLLRPLLHLQKQELLEFLEKYNIKYFEDESNDDESIKRNLFRHKYSTPLLQKYFKGIKKSFEYLDEDRKSLIKEADIHKVDAFAYFVSSHSKRNDIFIIDKYLKSQNYMLSAKERELLKNEETLIAGRRFVINQNQKFVFIVPYIPSSNLPKKFKEKMRLLKIEPKMRGYLVQNKEATEQITQLLL